MQAVDFDLHAGENLDLGDDVVVKPSHYTQYKIEPVTFIMENRLSFEVGNMVKYACRAGHKMYPCLLYTSPSPRDRTRSRMPSSA